MNALPPTALLVAVDFSPCSRRALAAALRWAPGESEVTVVHVVDTELAARLEATELCSRSEAIHRMRARGDRELERLRTDDWPRSFETMMVEGVPFLEIIKIASDLECDLIVLGSQSDKPGLGEFLFGSTAEKVLRGARQPVLCIP